MIEKYTNIEELTVPMINEYIEKVVVHESIGGRKGKERKQLVDVYLNFYRVVLSHMFDNPRDFLTKCVNSLDYTPHM